MDKKNADRNISIGVATGAGFGVALGLVLMNILGQPGFFALGIGIGLSIGTTIGLAMDWKRNKSC